MSEKLNWFAFNFTDGQDGPVGFGTVYLGFKDTLITVGKIQYAKEKCGVSEKSVLNSFSYMGEATREEIIEDYPIKEKV